MEHLTKIELLDIVQENIQEKENLEFLLDSLHGVSWEFDLRKQRFTYVSKNAEDFLGYELQEWKDFDSWKQMVHEEDRMWASEYCVSEINKGNKHSLEYRMLKKNGEVIWVLDAVTLAKDDHGNVEKVFGFIVDITQKKEVQEKLEKEHRFLQTVLNGISDPVMIINSDYSVDTMNDIVKKQTQGRIFLDPGSPKCYEISHHRDTPCDGIDNPCPLKEVIESKKPTTALHNHRDKDGVSNYVELAASPLFDEKGDCIGIIESARNVNSHITIQRELEAKTRALQYEATHDYLTGLPNRALFMDRLEQSVKDAKRHQSAMALFFMDLDHFKQINDTLGHHMGDAALKAVCRKFQSCARANDVLSRLAGDEFTLILKDVGTEEDVSHIAQKFIDIFKDPFVVDGHVLTLSVSIGISYFPYSSMHGYDQAFQEHVLQSSDKAMYAAKAKGKSNFQFAC